MSLVSTAASPLARRASSSALCSGLSGGRLPRSTTDLTVFLLITSSLLGLRAPGRDDADHVDALVFANRVGDHHEQPVLDAPHVRQRRSPPSIRSCSTRANGSAKARMAIWKLIPCLRRLLTALSASHSNLTSMPACYNNNVVTPKHLVWRRKFAGRHIWGPVSG